MAQEENNNPNNNANSNLNNISISSPVIACYFSFLNKDFVIYLDYNLNNLKAWNILIKLLASYNKQEQENKTTFSASAIHFFVLVITLIIEGKVYFNNISQIEDVLNANNKNKTSLNNQKENKDSTKDNNTHSASSNILLFKKYERLLHLYYTNNKAFLNLISKYTTLSNSLPMFPIVRYFYALNISVGGLFVRYLDVQEYLNSAINKWLNDKMVARFNVKENGTITSIEHAEAKKQVVGKLAHFSLNDYLTKATLHNESAYVNEDDVLAYWNNKL